MTSTYPRDMVGYGAEPPHAQWPGGARVALQFVINYEEGAENSILHGDTAAEAFLSEWIRAQPTLGMRNHEHGVALRIRQPGRILAALPRVQPARPAGDGLCRGDGARARSAGGGRRPCE